MLDFYEVIHNEMDTETYLNKKGLTIGNYSQFVDQGIKNIKFFRYMGWITDEEAQMIFNRIIAFVGSRLDVKQ